MKPLVFSVLVVALAPAAPALKPETGKNLDALQGRWLVEGNSSGPYRVPSEVLRTMTLTINADRLDIEPGLLATHRGDGSSTYSPTRGYSFQAKVDTNASPPKIDLVLLSANRPVVFRGIYMMDGDRLIIAYAKTGDRPNKFSTDGRPELTVLEFRRAKKKD